MTLANTLILALLFSAHPVHVSYSHLDIDKETQSVSVSHKILKDDFTLLFYHLFEKNIVSQPGIDFSAEELSLIQTYMKVRFVIMAGNDTIPLSYEHKDDNDAPYLWIYYKGKLPEKHLQELTINNTMLFDINMDQTNLLIINCGSFQKGLRFDWQNNQEMISIQE